MYRGKRGITPDKKLEIVEKIINNKISRERAAKELQVHKSTITLWLDLYQSEGPTAFLKKAQNNHYTKETMLAAVSEYQKGKLSMRQVCKKYGLRTHQTLIQWIKVYNNHEDFRITSGGSRMKKTRKTTLDERLEIVRYCLEHDRNYGEAAIRFEVSYHQARNWVIRYETMGEAGLQDRRGRRAGTQESRTPEEELRDQIARLERQNRMLQMENDLLKKVKELERGDH